MGRRSASSPNARGPPGRLGIDTEFMGEGRYRSLLCLVQVAVDEGDAERPEARVEVLDPLEGELDPRPLAEVLADPAIEVVMHAGRQDVALLRRVWETERHQRLRHPGRRGVRGPARPARLRGAAGRGPRRAPAQVRELHPLGRAAALARAGRVRPRGRPAPPAARRPRSSAAWTTWAGWSGRARSAGCWRPSATSARSTRVFERLPRINSLDPDQRAVARELVRLARAHRARRPTGPSRRSSPTPAWSRSPSGARESMERLKQIRGINEGTLHRRGQQILEVVERARDARADPRRGRAPRAARPAGRRADRARRGAGARPRPRVEAGLRADRRQGRPAADRRRGARRRARAGGAHRSRAGAASSSARSCSSCCAARSRCGVGPDRRLEVSA